MVDSGIKAHPSVTEMFDGLSTRTRQKYDYLIFDIFKKDGDKDMKVHVVSSPALKSSEEKYADTDTGKSTKVWYAFAEELKASKDPKIGICYLDFNKKDGAATDKLVFVYWMPETSKPKLRMIYSSTKESLKKKLNTSFAEVQKTDPEDIDYVEIVKDITKGNCQL